MHNRAYVIGVLLAAWHVAPAVSEPVRVPQRWASTGVNYAETDSLAAARLDDGAVRVFATAKEGDRIDVFDATNGKFIKSFGSAGNGPGQFAYPNGIVVAALDGKPYILIIERDNHRVQAFRADNLAPAGVFGGAELHRPYGAALATIDGAPHLFVTDTEVPAAETVNVYELALDGSSVRGTFVRSFGDADGPGFVRDPESIAIDPQHGHVLLCDEHKSARDVKVYTLDGTFTGKTLGRSEVEREPEGIVVVDSPAGGAIILTDQQKALSVWHLYDRRTFEHLGAFTGDPTVANTDGICFFADPFGPFPAGALFAVHDDADIRAYALADVLKTAKRE